MTFDELVKETGLSPAEVREVIARLKAAGYVRSDGRKYKMTRLFLDRLLSAAVDKKAGH